MNARLDMYPRIVERGDQAALLIDQPAWITMVREGREWKSGLLSATPPVTGR